MKIVFRGDDVGYTNTHNLGTYKAIEEGVVSSADLMLDTPGFVDACAYLKDKPWISIGWHPHFWGKPVLDPKEVSSLVNETGRFKWRKDMRLMAQVEYDEVYKECEAELLRCKEQLGRIPDVCMFLPWTFGKALADVCDKYGIVYNYFTTEDEPESFELLNPKYKDLHMKTYCGRNTKNPILNIKDPASYDLLKFIKETPIEDDAIVIIPAHPGFLDDYVMSESSCNTTRVLDVMALCSDELKRWIIDNKIEIINMHDALYGTNDYQNHLKEINSPLWIGNM